MFTINLDDMAQKILILGSQGMLGQELVRVFSADAQYAVTSWDREDIDVTDFGELKARVTALWPDVIVNAVAYNAVDLCEENDQEHAKAQMLNVTLPENLAIFAKTLQATLIHYSSDYVFDGERPMKRENYAGKRCCENGCGGCMYEGPDETIAHYEYVEEDLPRPLSRYGKTKYDGERVVEKKAGNDYYIIRLSKLFGKPAMSAAGKKSFFDVMLTKGNAAAKTGEEVKVIDGELSKFTYAPDLAEESKAMLDARVPSGIYHVVNDGAVTWYDGVKALYDIAGISVDVTPVSADTWPRPAKRPRVSVLAVTKRKPMRHYEDALREYVESRK